jgi:iron complex outermembrane receptor protein
MTNHISRHVLAACALAALAMPQAAQAQQKVADAAAALAASEGVETVTVTARRKSENEHNVPISMTVIGGDTLKVNGIQNALKLTELVPSLQVVSFNARNTNISVRGLGSNIGLANDGVEGGVGVYVDGVFYPRPAEATFDMPDISTIEELRGPQGTLYGKNTTSGAINITTEQPTEQREIKGEVSVGDYGYENAQGTIAGTIDEDAHLQGRLTGFETSRNGFITDVTTDNKVHDFHDYGVRGQARWEPTGDFTLRVIADYNKQRETCCITVLQNVVTTLDTLDSSGNPNVVPRNFYQRAAQIGYTPLPVDPFARETDANSPYHEIMEQGGLSAQADYRFGGGFDLTSITAYRFWNWNPDNDSDITSLSVLTRARQADEEKEFTQELRITSPVSDTFEYSAGLYYFYEDDHGFGDQFYGKDAPTWVLGADNVATEDALVGVGIDSQSDPRIDSYAAYGQATWHITPQLDLTGGVRYTYEQKTGSFFQNVVGGPDLSTLDPTLVAQILGLRAAVGLVSQKYFKIDEDKGEPAGLVTATYKFDEDTNVYGTFSHGAKSGGLNLSFLPTSTPPIPYVVQPEYEDNYELGFKSILFDHKLSLNADVFWDEDTNYQATIVNTNGVIVNYIANIPSVRSRGLEADLHATPFEGLSTYASGAYTDATYQKYTGAPCPFEDYQVNAGKLVPTICDLSGEALAGTSKWAGSVGGEYDHPVGDLGLGSTDAYLGVDVSYRSSFFSSADDSRYGRVPGYTLTNLRLGVRTGDGHWNLEAWSRNAFDTHYYQTIGKVAFNTGAYSALLGDPRTSGLTLRFNY